MDNRRKARIIALLVSGISGGGLLYDILQILLFYKKIRSDGFLKASYESALLIGDVWLFILLPVCLTRYLLGYLMYVATDPGKLLSKRRQCFIQVIVWIAIESVGMIFMFIAEYRVGIIYMIVPVLETLPIPFVIPFAMELREPLPQIVEEQDEHLAGPAEVEKGESKLTPSETKELNSNPHAVE